MKSISFYAQDGRIFVRTTQRVACGDDVTTDAPLTVEEAERLDSELSIALLTVYGYDGLSDDDVVPVYVVPV